MSLQISVVDLGLIGMDYSYEDCPPEEKKRVAKDIYDALSKIGFMYLKNHGIPKQEIKDGFDKSREFFSIPGIEKYSTIPPEFEGYRGPASETFDLSRIEHRESFTFTFFRDFLPKDCPGFEEVYKKLHEKLIGLNSRLLRLMALGLGLEENFFLKFHKDPAHTTTNVMRILRYPPMPDNVENMDNMDRIGSHTDYGTITFLMQDDVGGLQVKCRNGEWIEATPIKDTIIVNMADLMEVWTGGIFQANFHRIPVPKDKEKRKGSRYSMAFFINPDSDAWIVPQVGDKDKYPERSGYEHFKNRFLINHLYK